ncbi:MAG: hypothetical protein M9894_16255 [Planctomycetes bacterium]|nr:hypothetical protein [Planctomycetota bacterium]
MSAQGHVWRLGAAGARAHAFPRLGSGSSSIATCGFFPERRGVEAARPRLRCRLCARAIARRQGRRRELERRRLEAAAVRAAQRRAAELLDPPAPAGRSAVHGRWGHQE